MPVTAGTLSTLHSFCVDSNCTDGAQPAGGLIRDSTGNFYGTTTRGGASTGGGVVFEFVKTGKTTFSYQVLHSFCFGSGCTAGSEPIGPLIMDTKGALYGTTLAGGASDRGIVFRLKPDSTHTTWKFSKLYDFCAQLGCNDGSAPIGGLTYEGAQTGASYDGSSPLFGVTTLGGIINKGVAYKLTFVPGKIRRSEQVISRFCVSNDNACSDGGPPANGLLPDELGQLYGTTSAGGANGRGTVYRLEPASTTFTRTVLYSFCALSGCADGADPHSTLVRDGNGNIFGTTKNGGVNTAGVVFQLAPGNENSQETVIYTFCGQLNCTDGANPVAGLVPDSSGNLFGVTSSGGDHTSGVAFEVNANAFARLYSFCSLAHCADGRDPEANLLRGTNGNLFGTTLQMGGNLVGGTVFKITP